MADLNTLLQNAAANGEFARIANDRLAQFDAGPDGAPRYLGATLMPEATQAQNKYREEAVRYRTIIANSGTRYSSTQKKGGELVGTMDVELGESDIARELTGREYDTLLSIIGRNATMEAVTTVLRWGDTTLLRALLDYNEQQRWQAILDATVTRIGSNGYEEIVNYPNPAGHRATIAGGTVAAPAGWYDPDEDPFDDIFATADKLSDKGYAVNRIVTSRRNVGVLARHPRVRSRVGIAVISPTGQIQGASGRATLGAINDALQSDGLPPIEIYERRYRTETGTVRFFRDDAFAMLGTTGRNAQVDLGDDEPIPVRETLGYVGVGRATGQAAPGRVIRVEAFENKPPRVEGEAWQTSLPVITEPEAVAVLNIQAPA